MFLTKRVLSYHRSPDLNDFNRLLTIQSLACLFRRQIDEAWHVIAVHALRGFRS